MLRGTLNTSGAGWRWPDRIVTTGLLALIILTPFAIGSIHRGALVLVEVTIFALVVIWMVKTTMERTPARMRVNGREFARLIAPAIALVLLLGVQLTPMPSHVMRVVSPTSYHIYRVSFPGWPVEPPYQGLVGIWSHLPAGPARSLRTFAPASDSASVQGATSTVKLHLM
jgi:hypothetical protein